MWHTPHKNPEITIWPAVEARFALAQNTDPAFVWNAARYIDPLLDLLANLSLALAFLADSIHHFAATLAPWTRHCLDNAAKQRSPCLPNLAGTVAIWTPPWRRTRLRAV